MTTMHASQAQAPLTPPLSVTSSPHNKASSLDGLSTPDSLSAPTSPSAAPALLTLDKPPAGAAQLNHAGRLPAAVAADGMHFTMADGHRVLDAASGGAAVSCLGAGNTEVIQVMVDQATRMSYAYHQSLGNEVGEELAQWWVDRSDGAFTAGAFLSSGSEAMEAAIKLSLQYWAEKGETQRQHIIARFPSYHGNTLGALAVGNVPARRDLYKPLFANDHLHHVSSPTYYRSALPGETEEAYSQRLADELESKILELGPSNVVGFFAEPVVGAALGVMPPPRGYFPAVHAVLKKYDLLLVMDEVMSGSGRVGGLFAHQAPGVGEGVKPDIAAVAKGLGAGYVTISGAFVSERVERMVREAGQWKNSHTYQNHPVNCAVALKVSQIIEREGLVQNVQVRGQQLLRELRAGLKGVDGVVDVRGAGLFVGILMDAPASLKPRLAARAKQRCFENGVLVLGLSGTVDGVQGESVTLAPAYIVTETEVSEIVRLVVKSLKEVLSEVSA